MVGGLQVTLLDSQSDAVSITAFAPYVSTVPALELLTDDAVLAMRSPSQMSSLTTQTNVTQFKIKQHLLL
jgi:hypothetical protein